MMNADKNAGWICEIPFYVPVNSGTHDSDNVDINAAVVMVRTNLMIIPGCPADQRSDFKGRDVTRAQQILKMNLAPCLKFNISVL